MPASLSAGQPKKDASLRPQRATDPNQSGSLEDDTPEDLGIRQQVCRILEGGSDAFRKRERRYSLTEA